MTDFSNKTSSASIDKMCIAPNHFVQSGLGNANLLNQVVEYSIPSQEPSCDYKQWINIQKTKLIAIFIKYNFGLQIKYVHDHFPILFKIDKTTKSSNIHVTLNDHENIIT